MAKRGGSRPGAGRKAGVPNKINRQIKDLAGQHDELAIQTLADIAANAETAAAARVSAAIALLDRAHGKPSQAVQVGGDEENPLVHLIKRTVVDPKPRNPNA